jgi:FAD/FMN-containing dehydrogenase/Fe-S oxidoreductase
MTSDRFLADLRAAVPGWVDAGARRRAEYSADASNYRHVPRAVVFPGSAEEMAAAVAVAAAHGVPITMRGGGTSVAGNAIGTGLVIDCSRRLNRIVAIDPVNRSAQVEPGVVLDALCSAAAPLGLTFGPDPSTHSRATLGGMLGNNACGSHSPAWGRTVDHVLALDVLLPDGHRMTLRSAVAAGEPADRRSRTAELRRALLDLTQRQDTVIRSELGRFPRQISGYALHHLLPENGFDLARTLVGSEGTCAIVLGATVALVPRPRARVLLALGFDDLARAADLVPEILPLRPATCEGLDRALLPPGADPGAAGLPPGQGWLLLEFPGDEVAAAAGSASEAAAALAGRAGLISAVVITDPEVQASIWRIREDGAGAATRGFEAAGQRVAAWPGWEDAAVPPERLGDYLRAFRELMSRHNRRGVLYGHFGDGCLHVRIDFDLASAVGVAQYRAFVHEAADLVIAHGGSCSGEHGDGQARSGLLARAHSPEMLAAFAAFKAAWDPTGLLNPGVLVDPRPLDGDLRGARRSLPSLPLVFAYPQDGGSLTRALERCVGVGKCRQATGGVMCPSFRATGDEKDSTRGRARVLAEMMRGEVIADGWRSVEVLDALDLCLSCKGCRSDCPTGVDMATYKAEFLHHHYRRRARPAAHLSMGWLPWWARLARVAPGPVNALFGGRLTGPVLRRLGGLTDRRPLPRFAGAAPGLPQVGGSMQGSPVALWVDTFTAAFAPQLARSAFNVLVAAGLRVFVVPGEPCCALTWISTGQLGVARAVLRRTLDRLGPAAAAGLPIVGIEPSCLATLRTDLPGLLPADARAARVAAAVIGLAEALDRYAPDWRPPIPLEGPVAVAVHCHQHATTGVAAEIRLLARLGVATEVLEVGCCGAAGAFGFERDHYDTSVEIARTGLLPALARTPLGTTLLADGFSCRGQIAHLTQRPVKHLIEFLHSGVAVDAAQVKF